MTDNINLQEILNRADLDFEFYYKVLNKSFKNACRVRFFKNQPQVIILTDLQKVRMSVTNFIECIIPQLEQFLIIEKSIIIHNNCIYIEHYEKESWYDLEFEETFDQVTLSKSEKDRQWGQLKPNWSRLTEDEVLILISNGG